jgi:hypothetical protein
MVNIWSGFHEKKKYDREDAIGLAGGWKLNDSFKGHVFDDGG